MKRFVSVFIIGLFLFSAFKPNAWSQDQMVAMNFRNVDVDSVLRFFSEITGKTFVKDPAFQDRISLTTLGDASVPEAMQMFNSVLSLKGYTIVETGNVYKVVPLQMVTKTNVGVVKGYQLDDPAPTDMVITKMIVLQCASVSDIVETVRPLVGQFGSVIGYERTNTLIITDTAANIARLSDLVSELDRQMTSLVTKSYEVRYADVQTVADTIKEITTQYQKDIGTITLSVDKRTRTIFVTTVPENFTRVETLLKQLDKAVPQILLEVEVLRIPYRSIDVDIRHRLFEATKKRDDQRLLNRDSDRLFNWKYSLGSRLDKMFSWYGYSANKTKDQYMQVLNTFYGHDYFEVYALPILSVADNVETQIVLGQEGFFDKIPGLRAAFRLIPHLNEDYSVSFELYQHVVAHGVPAQDAYSQMILNSEQTLVVGGLNELEEAPVFDQDPLYRQDTVYISNEFLMFITPHVVLDAEEFKKALDQKNQEDALKVKKADLDTLFPHGFMEVDPGLQGLDVFEQKEKAAVNSSGPFEVSALNQVASDPVPDLPVAAGVAVPEQLPQDIPLDRVLGEMVVKQEPLVQYKDNMENMHFIDTLVRPSLREDAELGPNVSESEKLMATEPEALPDEPAEGRDLLGKDSYILKETLYRRGVMFYKKGQFKGAIREFAPIMSVDPHYKNVARYMELSQLKFKQQIQKSVVEQKSKQDQDLKALQDLTQTNMSMDQKKAALDEKESAGAYFNHDKVFEYAGDPAQIPADRIEQFKTDRLVGDVLEVSADFPLVILNIGSVHKVEPGMVFRVFRDNEMIGKVHVTDVSEHVSGAEVVSTIQPNMVFKYGDRVVQAI